MIESYYFIINSRIGEKKIHAVEKAIQQHFSSVTIKVSRTEFGGHAAQLAQEALAQNFSTLVAVGGDGTVNEIVQVIAKTPIALGIIPMGSGNGLARHCGISLMMDDALKTIINGVKTKIDLGKANHVYFISNAGVGLIATICNAIKQSKRRGLKMYIWNALTHFFTYKSNTYHIQIDENPSVMVEKYFVSIANGKEFGYGFQVSSEASLQDGLLDVLLVKKLNILNGLSFVYDGWHKKLNNNKQCEALTSKRITVRSDSLIHFQTDGDAHDCNGVCTFEVCEKALHILVPNNHPSL